MANLAKSDVTVRRTAFTGGTQPMTEVTLDLTLVLSSMGTTTNKIEAATLGLSKIYSSSCLVKSDDASIVVGGPSTDGTLLLVGATAGGVTGTYNCRVAGRR